MQKLRHQNGDVLFIFGKKISSIFAIYSEMIDI